MIRHSKPFTSESWKSLPWKKLRKIVFRLQKRIYKAVRVGDMGKARSLQKLVLKSFSARLLAIRQVTQLNAQEKTAGVDGKQFLTVEEKFALSEQIKVNVNNWKHSGLREIPIPKKSGKMRILKIPTIADRAWQAIAKYALEPAHEATFHERSYGFRTGCSPQDAQKILFLNLNSRRDGINQTIIELDIEKCFDRINHSAIMERLIATSGLKLGIFRCLKAGINPEFPEQETPSQGVVSPLLANIALNGIEELGNCVRYADNMVFMLKPEELKPVEERIKFVPDNNGRPKTAVEKKYIPLDVNGKPLIEQIEKFLAERGMNVSAKKTKATASTQGFDFLGWHFKVQSNGKFRCTPSVENFKAFRQKVKQIVNNSNYGADVKAEKLAPIVVGWRNYHKFCKMDGSRFSLWHLNHRTWKVFNKQRRQSKESTTELIRKAFYAVPYCQNRHIKVI